MIWFDLILCYKNHTHTMITPTPQTIHRNHDEINSVRSQSTRLISTHRHSSNYLSSLVGNGLWRPGALQKWIYTGIVQWLRFAIDHSFPTPPLKFALRGEIGIFFFEFSSLFVHAGCALHVALSHQILTEWPTERSGESCSQCCCPSTDRSASWTACAEPARASKSIGQFSKWFAMRWRTVFVNTHDEQHRELHNFINIELSDRERPNCVCGEGSVCWEV